MGPDQLPEAGSALKANWGRAIALSVGLIALLAFGTYLNYTQGETRDSSVAESSSGAELAATPVPTLTFTEWRSEAETISYDTLLGDADQNEGKTVYFRGQVGHIASATESYIEMWVYVALDDRIEGWGEDQVVLHYRNFPAGVNVEDIISFVAVMDGVDPVHHVPELTVKALEVE
ncbi:MAG: hypothetical protein F4148_05430 [Caldilineaceae bacterium SB0675_bin_29]|uniref:Uncharacterized protein n=1 Tax=Caldilineaceae bacterium SB0675_bin_29 TaxID=2605266 RepID=A0A6B1FYV3_9CHLR|nr:hypothetical protein [Caldilineaceae bacterium SB0675_bin_29]